MANPAADFPTALHSVVDISAFADVPLGNTTPTHSDVEGKIEEEIEAIETKLGIGSSTPSTGKVLYSTSTGQSAWTDLNTLVDSFSDVNSVNGKTGTVVLGLNDLSSPTGSFSMNTQKLVNLADPTAAQDAATKHYVDSVIKSPATYIIAPTGSGYAADYYTDGTADDVQIQAALDAMHGASGGKLLLKVGTYSLAATVKLYSNTSIVGEGREMTIVSLANAANVHMFTNADTTGGNSFIYLGNFSVNGNKANQTSGSYSSVEGIYFGKVDHVLVEDLYGHDTYGRFVHYYNCSQAFVTNSWAKNCGSFQEQSFTMEKGTENIFSDLYATGGTDRDFEIAFCTNSQLHNCTSDSPNGASLAIYATTTPYCSGIVVNGLISISPAAETIYLEGVQNFNISNVYGYNPSEGIRNYGTVANMLDGVFENINLYNPSANGILCDADRAMYSNVKIYNAGADGIRIIGPESRLVNCHVYGAKNNCFRIQGQDSGMSNCVGKNGGQAAVSGHQNGVRVEVTGVQITGSRFFDDQGTPTQQYGIREVSPADFGNYTGNDCRGNVTAGILLSGSNSVTADSLGFSDNKRLGGYMVIGSTSAPTNTTAGDLTISRFNIGGNVFSAANGNIVSIFGTLTDTSGTSIFANLKNTLIPASNSTAEFRALTFTNLMNAGTGVTLTTVKSGFFDNRFGSTQTGTITTVYGMHINGASLDSGSANITITNLTALRLDVGSRGSGSATATITTGIGLDTGTTANGGGLTYTNYTHILIGNVSATAVTTQIGIDVGALSRGGTTNIGIRIAKGNTYSLQLSDTGGTAAGGLTFGTDLQLWRSTTTTLSITDGASINTGTTTGLKIGSLGGASGQKIGFFGATPIVQPLLATGASHTVDDVITALQNLGLVRQS